MIDLNEENIRLIRDAMDLTKAIDVNKQCIDKAQKELDDANRRLSLCELQLATVKDKLDVDIEFLNDWKNNIDFLPILIDRDAKRKPSIVISDVTGMNVRAHVEHPHDGVVLITLEK